MIFHLYSRVIVKLGDGERHIFDRSRLMFTEVAEIQKVTGLSYGEWEQALGRYDITAVAALLHVLRKRDDQPSEWATLQFNVAELDVVPLHDDDREFTPEETAADLKQRMEARVAQAANGAGPTRPAAASVGPEPSPLTSAPPTSGSSQSDSGSGPGNGNGSPGRTSARSRRAPTPS